MPALLLIPFTAPTLFVVNAVSFVASAALLASIRGAGGLRRRARPDSAQPSAVTSGVVSLIWPLVASRAVVACVYGFDAVLLTVIASWALHGTSGYGWLLSAAGVGGLLAVVLVGRTEGRRIAPVASLGLLLYALPLVLFALDPPIAAGIPVQIARGIGSVVTLISGLQRAVPSPMAGRVFGTMQSRTSGDVPRCGGRAYCWPRPGTRPRSLWPQSSRSRSSCCCSRVCIASTAGRKTGRGTRTTPRNVA